jgi:hypothetical protein
MTLVQQYCGRSALAFAVLLTLSTPVAHAQKDGAGHVAAGLAYVRAYGGSGWGGELNATWYLPVRLLSATSGVGPRAWVAGLQEPNDWHNPVRMAGLGVRWRSQWDLFDRRVRSYVTLPLELVLTSRGLTDLRCLEANGSDVCNTSHVTPAIGAGGGVDVVLPWGLTVTGGVTCLWLDLDRNESGVLWTGFLGISVGWSSEA